VSSGLDYGRMRLWGSLTFIVAGFVGGALIDRFSGGIGAWLLVVGAAATAAATHLLPRPSPATTQAPTQHAPTPHAKLNTAQLLALIRSPVFLVFLLAAGFIQGAHANFYAFGTLRWGELGISATWAGALWAIGVIAEIVVFIWSGALIRRFGAVRLLIIGAVAAVARWTIMAADPPLAALIPLQLAHGLTYGASHIGAIHFIGRAVPRSAAGTAQAIYATIAIGLALGSGTLIAGALDAVHNGAAYLVMALEAAIGLAAALWLLKLWSGGLLTETVSPTVERTAA
jgi:PPP family 3-phenylpropionic acid transporter